MFARLGSWLADRIAESKDEAVLDAAALKSAAYATPAPSPEDAAIANFDSGVDRLDDERHGRSG